MNRPFVVGIDLGLSEQAEARAAAAAHTGASLARVRFTLGGRPFPDAQYLEHTARQIAAVRAAGLAVLAVIDGHLTVAPAGIGPVGTATADLLAAAWADELVANASALATAIGPDVAWWELLPAPNAGTPANLAPGRWAELVARLTRALRSAAPGAAVATGGLVSDESDDGVEYLRAAWLAAETLGSWPAGHPPMDAVGVRLAILPDGGSSEEAVSSALRHRVQRLGQALAGLTGPTARPTAILVTGVAWDAERAGETAQARNLWVALDTLSTEATVCGAVWDGLQDHAADRSGLYRATGLDPDSRRPAWQALSDFGLYLRQIAPASEWLEPPGGSADAPLTAGGTAPDLAEDASAALWARLATDEGLPEPDVFPPPLEAPPVTQPPAPTAGPSAADEVTPIVVPPAPEPTLPQPGPAAVAAGVAALASAGAATPDEAEAGSPAPVAEEAERTHLPPAPDEPTPSVTAEAAPVAPGPVVDSPAPPPGPAVVAGGLAALAAASGGEASQADVAPEPPGAPPELTPVGEALPVGDVTAPPAGPEAAEAMAPVEIVFRMPTVAEVLRDLGLTDADVAGALAALALEHGDVDGLRPGEYRVALARPTAPVAEAPIEQSLPVAYTNQQVISALYRAGGGSWALFERAGLALADLAGHRNAPYIGPPPAELGDLTAEERQAVTRALAEVTMPA